MRALWDKYRGKGRTRRMLKDAVTRMLAGASVYVVVRDAQVDPCMNMLAFLAPAAEHRNDREVFQGSGFIRFMSLPRESLQRFFQDGKFYGTSDGATVLIDHHVIEQELGYALDQWLTWCGPEFGIVPEDSFSDDPDYDWQA